MHGRHDDDFCERHVIRYDIRDTGRFTIFPNGRSPSGGEALIEDAVGLLDQLDMPEAHIVGISMGGGIAQVLAVRSWCTAPLIRYSRSGTARRSLGRSRERGSSRSRAWGTRCHRQNSGTS